MFYRIKQNYMLWSWKNVCFTLEVCLPSVTNRHHKLGHMTTVSKQKIHGMPLMAGTWRFTWWALLSTGPYYPQLPNTSQRRQKRTEPWPQATCKKWWSSAARLSSYASRQTNKQTYSSLYFAPFPGGSEVGLNIDTLKSHVRYIYNDESWVMTM